MSEKGDELKSRLQRIAISVEEQNAAQQALGPGRTENAPNKTTETVSSEQGTVEKQNANQKAVKGTPKEPESDTHQSTRTTSAY